jgi:hypothetical protein
MSYSFPRTYFDQSDRVKVPGTCLGKLSAMRVFHPAFVLFATMIVIPAAASTRWNWSYSGSGITATGTFATVDSPNANGGYLITAIAGTRNGEAITKLQAPGTWIPGNEPYLVDNLVFAGPGPQLTKGGFGFGTANGNFSNPFYADFLPTPSYLEFFSKPPFLEGDHTELPIQFSAKIVATPEPASFLLVLIASAFVAARSIGSAIEKEERS